MFARWEHSFQAFELVLNTAPEDADAGKPDDTTMAKWTGFIFFIQMERILNAEMTTLARDVPHTPLYEPINVK